MRRIAVGLVAFVAMTGTVLVLPVYAAPVPAPRPVHPSIDSLTLGAVTAPAADAVVTDDGAVVAAGRRAGVVPGGRVRAGASPSRPSPSDATVATTGQELAGVPALTLSRPHTDRFSALGVTWAHDAAVTDVRAHVRVADRAGHWGRWTALELENDTLDAHAAPTAGRTLRDGTAPYWTAAATGVEVVLQAPHGALPHDVSLQLIDPGSSPTDADPGAAGIRDQAHADAAAPAIYSRAQWGADESIRTWDPQFASTIKAATIHHTDTTNDYTAADVPGIIRSIYAFHAISRGWGDIGYNVLVDKFGRAWEGRYSGSRGVASPVIGAHAGGFNDYTVGVSMIGDYTTVTPPDALQATVAAVIAWKFSLYHVNPVSSVVLISAGGGTDKYAPGVAVRLPAIFGHRDVGNTTCPGDAGYAQLQNIRVRVEQRMGGYSVPFGSFQQATGGIESVTVRGWAVDWDAPNNNTTVHLYADGRKVAQFVTSVVRPDVRAVYPTTGPTPGFSGSVTLAAGVHQLCVYAINTGPGYNRPLGCRPVTVTAARPTPRGVVDRMATFGSQVMTRGWAVDENELTTSLRVHVYVDGRYAQSGVADQPRSDIPSVYPTAGRAHGFDQVITLSDGNHTVCVYAINVGAGTVNPLLGCGTVTTGPAASSPIGSLTTSSISGRTATVAGWAVDPQAPTTGIGVHVYVDGHYQQSVTADQASSATAALAPFGVNGMHGFGASLTLAAGTHSVCAYGINTGAGSHNTALGCASLTVAASAWNPVGHLENVTLSGRTASLSGWALDADAPTSPVNVHVYVDGRWARALPADGSRPDVGAAFPGAGDDHGFTTALVLAAGTHTVCAYAINIGQGSSNPSLGCGTVAVPASAYDPQGHLDSATVAAGTLTATGWAFDPDVPTTAIRVHVYIDGHEVAAVTADGPRPDVGAAFPGVGDGHGFTATATLSSGNHTVCAYAINQGTGTTNPSLGCQTVSA